MNLKQALSEQPINLVNLINKTMQPAASSTY